MIRHVEGQSQAVSKRLRTNGIGDSISAKQIKEDISYEIAEDACRSRGEGDLQKRETYPIMTDLRLIGALPAATRALFPSYTAAAKTGRYLPP